MRWVVAVATGTLFLVPVGLWVFALARFAANVPVNDDYVLVEFMTRWLDPATTALQRLGYLFAPHNTHQIVYDRLVALASYFFTGRLNFWLLTLVGNAALLGILWRLFTPFASLKLPGWYFLPLPALLLSLQSHENMFWAMAALQNFTVVYFIFEALHRLHRHPASTGGLAMALVLSMVAVLTSGSGFLAFGVGALVLVWQRRWRVVLPLWLAITAIALVARLVYAPLNEERTPLLGWLPKTGLALSGLFTNAEKASPMLWGVGAVVLLALAAMGVVWVVQSGRSRRQLAASVAQAEWFSFVVVVAASALLIAMHRQPNDVLRDRYKIYSHLAVGLLYLVGLVRLAPRYRPVVGVGATGVAFLLNILAFHVNISKVAYGHQISQANAYNFSTYQTLLPLPYYQTDRLMRQAQALGIYQFPRMAPAQPTWRVVPLPTPVAVNRFRDTTVTLSFVGYHPPVVQIDQRAFQRGTEGPGLTGLYTLLNDGQRQFMFPAAPSRSGILEFLTTGRLFATGFTTSFYESVLPPGTYRVGLLQTTHGTTTYFQTNQRFTVLPR